MTETTHFYQMFEPDEYQIFLDIDREKKTINGITKIKGTAIQDKISLHQKFLDIQKITANNNDVPFEIDNKAEAIRIKLPEKGAVNLEIQYSAPLTDTMMGIYPSYYEIDGVKKQIIGTQFETTSARQAFPGIDEPEAKAVFNLAIKFDEKPGETILSNMPEKKVVNGVHYFEPTFKMSTYLVAFGFGELQSKKTKTKSGIEVGVFATLAHKAKELDFALDIAKRSIEFYEDFYQTTYPLPQSYQLALPDFSAGAMENWGLITYREAYLLLDPENTAFQVKQVVATVIAHELAHQWFGDLVTMKWWDDLWLNESFANMMEYVAIDAIEPNWKIWEVFQTSDVPAALQRDATDGVQPVHVAVEDPAEIDALFDAAIVYAKGARMLVMVRALIGDEALRKGLKSYFSEHQYGNATGADLWNALGKASGIDVGTIMRSWLEQPGYPVVTAKLNNDEMTLTQDQFFIGKGKDVDRSWQIPLNSNCSELPKIMIEKRLNIPNYQKNQTAFRLNIGNNSHFITNYDDKLLNDILNELSELDAISQLQILQDQRLLAEGRKISFAKLVPLLPKFKTIPAQVVGSALYQCANRLKNFVKDNSQEEKNLQKLFDILSNAQLERLGWNSKDNESNDDKLMRPFIIKAALYARNPKAINDAHLIYTENRNDPAKISADIRSFVLINEVKNEGSQALFDHLLDQYRNSPDASYKSDLKAALTQTTDDSFIKKLIISFKDANTIKPQDLRGWFAGLLANDHAQQITWDWFRDNWQWLSDTLGGDMEFTTYITVIANVFHTQERLAEFKAFFEPKINTPGLTREITMDIKVIAGKVELINDQAKAVNNEITKIVK